MKQNDVFFFYPIILVTCTIIAQELAKTDRWFWPFVTYVEEKNPPQNPSVHEKVKVSVQCCPIVQLTYCQKKTLIQEITSESREYNLPETFEEKKLRLINLSGTQFLMRELNGLIVSTGTY